MRIKKTSFRAIIISTRKVKLSISVAIWIMLIVVGFFLNGSKKDEPQRLVMSDSFYKTIIASQLHNEDTKISLRDIAVAMVGFDIEKTNTIIKSYSPMLSEEYIKPVKVREEEKEKEQVQETKVVEERKISGDMKISNLTDISIDAMSLVSKPLEYSIKKGSAPQILIFHTHTTESFTEGENNTYIIGSPDRNLDNEKNISAVGKAMKKVLEKEGYKTIHDTTVHDYPSYNGAYERSMATAKKNISEEKGIKLLLDVHRDGITKDDGTKVKVVSDIEDEKVAQCMFVIGSNALLSHDKWQENLKLALKLQSLANEMYPGLMRPIIIREERFNQQLSTGSIIIEVGSNGNTIEEAIRGGECMARVIARLFEKNE